MDCNDYAKNKFIVASYEMMKVIEMANKAARNDVSVFLEGETGVGKGPFPKPTFQVRYQSHTKNVWKQSVGFLS